MQRRKRKLEQEQDEDQPNKYQKTEEDEDDILDNEKFEYFLSLPVELHYEIYQRCTFPVKIHFSEVCKAFSITGGWLQDLVFAYPHVRMDVKPNILTRFTSLKKLCNGLDLPQYPQYLTALEELVLTDRRKPIDIIPAIPYLTNLRKLRIPQCVWKNEDEFENLTKLTRLQSLYINCNSFLVKHTTAFKHLTAFRCAVEISRDAPEPAQFRSLTNLKLLNVWDAGRIVGVDKLTQLEVLRLLDADIEDINTLQNFKNLTRIEFATLNNVKTVNLTVQMTQVKQLFLRNISVSEAFIRNFPNLTSYKIRGGGKFILPPNAEQLTRLSVSDIKYTEDNMKVLATLTNLKSLQLQGDFRDVSAEEFWNLPTTLREIEIADPYGPSVNISLYLTKLGNLERVNLSDVFALHGSEVEERIKQFLTAMPQLKYSAFKGVCCASMTFPRHKAWFDYLRKNKIYTFIEFEDLAHFEAR